MMVFCLGDLVSFCVGFFGVLVLLLGGEMMNGLWYIWWNFVLLLKEKIEEVKCYWCEECWGEGIFDLLVGD